MQRITSELPAMLERLRRAGDERGLAKAHMSSQWVHWLAGQATAAGEEARIAAAHAHAAGDERLRARAVSYQLEGLILGRQHASEIDRELGEIERQEPGPYLSATIKRGRAAVCRLEGRFEQARALLRDASDDLDALGMRTVTAYDYMRVAELELAAGDLAAARDALEQGDLALAGRGERAYRSTIQAYLAHVRERMQDRDAARSALTLAEELSVPDDVMNHAIIGAVRARLALADGDSEAAERCARGAVGYTLQTDFVLDQARARMTLADVLAALGRRDEAIAEAKLALELHEAKGDLPGANRAQALLERLSAAPA
jgi:tetratricopeptide (TPR) repeat protein